MNVLKTRSGRRLLDTAVLCATIFVADLVIRTEFNLFNFIGIVVYPYLFSIGLLCVWRFGKGDLLRGYAGIGLFLVILTEHMASQTIAKTLHAHNIATISNMEGCSGGDGNYVWYGLYPSRITCCSQGATVLIGPTGGRYIYHCASGRWEIDA